MSNDETDDPTIRTDKENDLITIGDAVAFSLVDSDGEKMTLDHASPLDGYVAFIGPSGTAAMVQFEEVPADE